jgi:hypothetical protein
VAERTSNVFDLSIVVTNKDFCTGVLSHAVGMLSVCMNIKLKTIDGPLSPH